MTQTNEITNLILQDLFRRQIFAWRNSVGTGSGIYTDKDGNTKTRWFQMGKSGASDIIAALPPNGQFLAIEIKTGRDRMRLEQLGFKANLEKMGGIYWVIKDFEDYQGKINTLSPQ